MNTETPSTEALIRNIILHASKIKHGGDLNLAINVAAIESDARRLLEAHRRDLTALSRIADTL